MGKRPSWHWEREQRENTAKKKLGKHYKRRENSKKILLLPQHSVYKRFGLHTQQRTDSFSPHSSGKWSTRKAPSWRNPGSPGHSSLQQEAGNRKIWEQELKVLKGILCLCQRQMHRNGNDSPKNLLEKMEGSFQILGSCRDAPLRVVPTPDFSMF